MELQLQPRPERPHDPVPYPGEKARQGRIVLDTPRRRAIFLSGLAGGALLVIAAVILL
jgi:hypothetical protein